MEDGRVYAFEGLKVAGVCGIIARKRKVKKGVPRKTPEEFLGAAEKLRNKGIDVLLIHEAPYLPDLFPFMRDSISSRTALRAIEIVKPRVVFNGHMHFGGYKIYEFSYGTKNVYLDSSQANRHYAILYTNNAKLEMWRDREVVDVAEYL